MPRVHFVKKAKKDNPCCKKGESYYWFSFRYGGKRFSKTYPKRSQLTQSSFYAQLYDIQDSRDNICSDFRSGSYDLEAFASEMENLSEQLQELGSECQDSFDNMPEGLQQGDTGQLLEERVSFCESAGDELTSGCDKESEWEETDPEGNVEVECTHCGDTSQELAYDFRGSHTCTACNKKFKVTSEIMNPVLQERAEERENLIEEIVSEVEGADLDCS